MSQTTMEVIEREYAAAEHARREAECERWANYGRGVGLLTLDELQRATRPQWAWDDYSI